MPLEVVFFLFTVAIVVVLINAMVSFTNSAMPAMSSNKAVADETFSSNSVVVILSNRAVLVVVSSILARPCVPAGAISSNKTGEIKSVKLKEVII